MLITHIGFGLILSLLCVKSIVVVLHVLNLYRCAKFGDVVGDQTLVASGSGE